jgi:hypothetical protein
MRKMIRICLLLAFAGLIGVASTGLPSQGTAEAQEVRQNRSIIEFLFGIKPKSTVNQSNTGRVRQRRKKILSQTPSSPDTATLVAEKSPDARKVLVIGDFMASALADGLVTAFADDPNITIIKQTDGSSGLVRIDHLDWASALISSIEANKPAVVVVMLGTNDRQQMPMSGAMLKFRSDAWNAAYDKRVTGLIGIAISHKIPLIWSGLPAFQSPSLSTDVAAFNNLYREKTELAGGVFVDLWDGFADENGKFIASGSDINGQPVRLRGSDGLSLTKAGKRKMAFYLEKPIRDAIGTTPMPGLSKLDSSNLPLGETKPDTSIANILSVPPISLADPELDGSATLLDMQMMRDKGRMSPRDLLIDKGETGEPPEGRVDNFRIPDKKPAG